jgi:sporulation protein YlmC with PRC-barrel domain
VAKIEKQKKTLTKGGLIGMQVIDGEGNSRGTVQDVTVTVGETEMTLIVASKEGQTSEVAWDDIQAAGEFVILKAKSDEAQISGAQSRKKSDEAQISGAQSRTQQPVQAQSQICPTCGGPLTFIPKYNRWYCYKDKKYV